MAASSPADALRAVAEPLAAGAGLVLENITVTPAGKRRVVRIVVDLPDDQTGSVSLEHVADVSHAISAALEDNPVLGEQPYVLEVTSPGVSRPLTQRRHWLRARTRLVRAEPVPGVKGWTAATSSGRLAVVDDEGIEFDDGRRLPWDQIGRGLVQVEFGRPPGSDQDDDQQTDGTDATDNTDTIEDDGSAG